MSISQVASDSGHSWWLGCYLLVNGIVAPALLAMPYAFAVLGWAGGISITVIMALASWYCMYHQALLFHHNGGRHITYKRMGNAILAPYLGRWGGVLIAGLQYFINVGATITNIILTGQLLQSVYTDLCGDPATCSLQSTSGWIAIGGGLSFIVFLGLPNMATLAWASIVGTALSVYYCVAAMVMAGVDGNASTANYTITGPMNVQFFNALNGIGVCLFLFGITVMPEIQAVLRNDPTSGNTSWPMIKAATLAHFVFVPLYLLVGIVGFWAYGTDVNGFLLFANSQPLGLVVSAEIAAAVQLQLVNQVLMLPVFEATERVLLRRFPRCHVCQHAAARGSSKEHGAGGDAAVQAPALRRASSAALSAAALSKMFSRSDSRAHDHDEDFNHQRNHQQQLESSNLQQQPDVEPAAAGPAMVHGAGQNSQDDAAAESERHDASWLLMAISRTLISGSMVFVACALPFFSSIMGFFGSVGFGPVTYALPTVLYIMAKGSSMPAWEQAFNWIFVAFWLAASLLGAIGSVFTIIMTASTYRFFS